MATSKPKTKKPTPPHLITSIAWKPIYSNKEMGRLVQHRATPISKKAFEGDELVRAHLATETLVRMTCEFMSDRETRFGFQFDGFKSRAVSGEEMDQLDERFME
jgi:hypothetical protein